MMEDSSALKKEKVKATNDSKEKIIGSTKVKSKSYRPIILLRRNSCGNVTNRSHFLKSPVGIPRLKSMTEIERRSRHRDVSMDKENDPPKKKDPIPELSSDETSCGSSVLPSHAIKTEIVENCASSSWMGCMNRQNSGHKQQVQNMWQPNQFPVHNVSSGNSLKGYPLMPNAGFFNAHSQTFMKQEPVAFPQCHPSNVPTYCGSSQPYQNIQPMSIPLNDATMNTFLPDVHEQYSTVSNVPGGQLFLSSVPQNSPELVPMELNMPENTPVLFSSNTSHTIVSEGAIIQRYSPNPVFQVESAPMGASKHTDLQFNPRSRQVQPKYYEPAVTDDSLTNITWLGRMGVNNFMPVPLEKERKCSERNDKRGRPPYSYMALIQFAINSSANGRMTLRQIYQWIEEKFPYFKTAKPGWKNSIRHNLSLHDLFVREVTTGSKISYWTLRADLNIRPLTLDSVTASSSQQGPVWSLQTCGQGQKPILPRLPYCSRPYILLPVPLLQSNKDGNASSENPQQSETSDTYSQDASLSSSAFADSGINSDMSQYTPRASSKNFSAFSSESGSLFHNESSSVLVKQNETIEEPSPLLSQSNVRIGGSSSKRSRKQPMKTLNDSLNSSLRFLKEELNSPPPRKHLSPSGEQFLLCKKMTKKSKKKEADVLAKSSQVGLSDESFSELLDDLGSPFKTYLTHNTACDFSVSPKMESARKRRRSWGSPESSCSGPSSQRKFRAANEQTPCRQLIRRVKSEAGDLAHVSKNEESFLPTSTPLNQDKWKSQSSRSSNKEIAKDEGTLLSAECTPTKSMHWRGHASPSDANLIIPIPSPIRNHKGSSEDETDFFQDIIGTVFKTPDKPSAPVRHFESLSPEQRSPFTDVTSKYINGPVSKPNLAGGYGNLDDSLTGFTALTPSKEEPLNTSFSKLLDISGGSNSFTRLSSNYPDVNDLNMSWSNLPNF